MTEEEIRADERQRMILTLTIIMLPDHDYLFDQVEAAISKLPPLPLARHAQPSFDETGTLTGAALGRWCYENPNLAAQTIEGLRRHAQCAPATGSLLEEARKRYPQTGGTHRQAFIEGAQWAAITSSAPAAQRVPDERRAFEKWLPDHLMPSEFSHGFLFQRDEDRYTICFVQDAWDGWMARAALTSTDGGGK